MFDRGFSQALVAGEEAAVTDDRGLIISWIVLVAGAALAILVDLLAGGFVALGGALGSYFFVRRSDGSGQK